VCRARAFVAWLFRHACGSPMAMCRYFGFGKAECEHEFAMSARRECGVNWVDGLPERAASNKYYKRLKSGAGVH